MAEEDLESNSEQLEEGSTLDLLIQQPLTPR
jgi:hypothetical protein